MAYRVSVLSVTGVTEDINAAVGALKGLSLVGVNARESAGSASAASFNITIGTDAQDTTKAISVELGANEHFTHIFELPVNADAGISIESLSGTVDVNLYYILDDGGTAVTNTTPEAAGPEDVLLLEIGDAILLESGDRLLLE